MKLIVGLGNPDKKYRNTRHNIGFMALDAFAERSGVSFTKQKKLHSLEARIPGEETVILLKPQTYMNRSGVAVKAVRDFYSLDTSDILVVYDELALPLGTIRARTGGESAGHNGIKSIINHCGEDFHRIRIGIANQYTDQYTSDVFVLNQFNREEQNMLPNIFKSVTEYVETFVRDELRPDTEIQQ